MIKIANKALQRGRVLAFYRLAPCLKPLSKLMVSTFCLNILSTFVESWWEMLRPCRVMPQQLLNKFSTNEMSEIWDWEQCWEELRERVKQLQHFKNKRNVEDVETKIKQNQTLLNIVERGCQADSIPALRWMLRPFDRGKTFLIHLWARHLVGKN